MNDSNYAKAQAGPALSDAELIAVRMDQLTFMVGFLGGKIERLEACLVPEGEGEGEATAKPGEFLGHADLCTEIAALRQAVRKAIIACRYHLIHMSPWGAAMVEELQAALK